MILLMGIVGAGKSLQGKMFADEQGYPWISTGELFRALVTGERREQLNKGILLSDEEVIALVDKTFKSIDLDKEFLLDGFPRTTVQADWLLGQISSGRLQLTAVFNLTAEPEVIKKRLLNRGRVDDDAAVIERRLEEYRTKTLPMLDYFRQHHAAVFDINADQTPDAVHAELVQHIQEQQAV